MTTEILNYFIHFVLMALIGLPWIVFGFSNLLGIQKIDRLTLTIILALKMMFLNVAFLYMDMVLGMDLALVIIIPLTTVIYIISLNGFCMWKGKQDYLHAQIAAILIEVMALITITFPYFALSSLLDPNWGDGMNSPFRLLNAMILFICFIIAMGVNLLLKKQMKRFSQIKFKKKAIWYSLCIIYTASGIIGHTTVDTSNAWKCIVYQIILILCGALLIYTIAKVLERKEARRILCENKYLLEEQTLLIEYNKMVDMQVNQGKVLLEEIAKVREEIEIANVKLKDKEELKEYMNELEEMLKK